MRRLIAILMLVAAGTLAAQETSTTTATATTTAVDAPSATDMTTLVSTRPDSGQLREEFNSLLRKYPPQLGDTLALDPTLLSNESYLASYPELRQFLLTHPEVRHQPGYYLSQYGQAPPVRMSMFEHILEMLGIGFIFSLITFSFGWLVRTAIEQRRWGRLARVQSEVHNKILDRFGTSTELLEYMKTPAGSKFLESAPIPLHAEKPIVNAPLARVLWSIQLGVVIAAAAIGMLLVSGRFDKETAQGFFAMGMIGLSIGLGFIASAAVSLFVSRRLGLWSSPSHNDAELMP